MTERFNRAVLCLVVLAISLGASGCFRRTFVVVPQRNGGYGPRDTLYAQRQGQEYRVVFRHDTTWRVDTVVDLDTLWRGGTRYIRDTVVRVVRDTVYFPAPVAGTVPRAPGGPVGAVPAGTVPRTSPAPTRRDTIYLPDPRRGRDTVYLPQPGSGSARVDTVRITVRDTLRLTIRDTVRLVTRDTLRLVVRDTILIPGGRRLVFVPPGQFPREGQCRVWIADRAVGQQARAAACDRLGPIPAGAFVLFDDVAWDMDHDWLAESRRAPVPPEIVAIARRAP